MRFIVLGAAMCVLSSAQPPDYKIMWKWFKKKYNKRYPAQYSNTEQDRFEIFKANLALIESHNAKNSSYWLRMNEFSDHTLEEFAGMHLGYNPIRLRNTLPTASSPKINDVASSIDWVAKGGVTPVKNQQQCGSCWAFSTTGALEGALFVSTGRLQSLSEEQLVRCDQGNSGCDGGLMEDAFEWVKHHGLCSEDAYPYTSGTGTSGTCSSRCQPVMRIGGHSAVPSKDEDALKAAVSRQPVSVAISASTSAFMQYGGGIFDDNECGTDVSDLDHGVLVVGYGTEMGKNYWKVKNSWGRSWGEHGYIRMMRDVNQCAIAMLASYPTGAESVGPSPPPAPPSPPSPPQPVPPSPSPSPPVPPSPSPSPPVPPSPSPTPPVPPSPSPPFPPTPPSPPSSGSHYGDPKDGCGSDEADIMIEGIIGTTCAPLCTLGFFCPADRPSGVTAWPLCALQDSDADYCALICSLEGGDYECGAHASCKRLPSWGQIFGICTYDNSWTSSNRVVVQSSSSVILV